jgi:methionine-rich copper-binding protein CopC
MTVNTQRMGRAFLAISMAATLMTMVQAHAKLEKSEPADKSTLAAPPAHVQLWFDDDLDVKASKIALKGTAGPVKLGPVHLMGDKTMMADITGAMADGKYTIDWQTAGDDGHVSKGVIAFTVARKK